jgi:hypothetical protein
MYVITTLKDNCGTTLHSARRVGLIAYWSAKSAIDDVLSPSLQNQYIRHLQQHYIRSLVPSQLRVIQTAALSSVV